MKLVKSLLLGSAAGIAAVAGAQAADLPSRKAAPVEYVRVCSAYGAGFFYIPGTDTCLRIGGRLRAEYEIGERWSRGQDGYGTRVRGRLNLDARTATAYGTLRTFIRYDVTNTVGAHNNGRRVAITPGAALGDPTVNLDKAFVQFGPITAGRAQSFFDFYANDLGFHTVRTSDRSPHLLAYTATFGSGFSATISIEDPKTTAQAQTLIGTNAGSTYPDLVASLRVDQGWGSAQLSGAFGNRSTFNPGTGVKREETGWAIQAGAKINLPMLAAGDHIWLQAAYADGAIEYLGWGNSVGVGRVGGSTLLANYAFDNLGNAKSISGFSIVAGLRHFWTPTIRTDVYGSYSELDTPRTNILGVLGSLDPKELTVGANVVWSPVSGLDIGVEVLYQRVEFGARVADLKDVALGAPTVRTRKSDDAFTGRLRIQRDF
ncbi:hypothetical protein ASE63_13555 [Bosea sp. Root381]|uniref:porin n=1 Tax=Bosea sp. Root381 TaxID=1736524 RepID=UPI0006FA9D3B|nr:porin [Bosea sp. Root381]KRE17471.1 hypothetical protein ASE63_13555 [Bosea sp. Root381]